MRWRKGNAAAVLCLFGGLSCAAPAVDPLSDTSLALDNTECTLGADCDQWGPLIADDVEEDAECVAVGSASIPLSWFKPFSEIGCPFGRCELYDQQLSLDDDGSLVTLGAVQLPAQHGTGQEGGLWLARYSPTGALRATRLWDFSVPPPGLEVERHARLLQDASGRTIVVSSRALVPFDAPRPLRASLLSRSRELSPTGELFATPPGWGVLVAATESHEWVVASQRNRPKPQVIVTRYDQRGRLRWNRVWPEGSTVGVLQASGDQATFVSVSEQTPDTHTLHKLDKTGRVSWRRVIGSAAASSQIAVTKDAVYIATTLQSDLFFGMRIQKFSPTGESLAAWLIPDVFSALPNLGIDATGNVAFSLPGFSSTDFLPTLDWYDLASTGECRRTSYTWPAQASNISARIAVQTDRRGARFVATPEFVAQLPERDQP